jgi:hypothetical protein
MQKIYPNLLYIGSLNEKHNRTKRIHSLYSFFSISQNLLNSPSYYYPFGISSGSAGLTEGLPGMEP